MADAETMLSERSVTDSAPATPVLISVRKIPEHWAQEPREWARLALGEAVKVPGCASGAGLAGESCAPLSFQAQIMRQGSGVSLDKLYFIKRYF